MPAQLLCQHVLSSVGSLFVHHGCPFTVRVSGRDFLLVYTESWAFNSGSHWPISLHLGGWNLWVVVGEPSGMLPAASRALSQGAFILGYRGWRRLLRGKGSAVLGSGVHVALGPYGMEAVLIHAPVLQIREDLSLPTTWKSRCSGHGKKSCDLQCPISMG